MPGRHLIFKTELTDGSGQVILTLVLDALIHSRPSA
jgi:hypothetical protein